MSSISGPVEEVETSSPHAEFDVSWSASDDGGNLDSVSVQLRDATAGEFDDSDSEDVSGSSASGTNRLSAHKDDESGNDYEATANVRDTSGNSGEDAATVTENGR